MPTDPAFEVQLTVDADLGRTLLVGVVDIGVAGLTAVDYLSTHLDTDQIGHLETHRFPDITPFSNGTPRYPMRLYNSPTVDLTIFISEVFLPVGVADAVTNALLEWVSTTSLDELVFLYGAPFPHAEDQHAVFYVGTNDFRDTRMVDSQIQPLAGGFFDGVVAECMVRGIDGDGPAVGALVTPAHFPGPDLDGALRLIDGFNAAYGIDVDVGELAQQSEEFKEYYQGIANRVQTLREGEPSGTEFPEDRMYM